MNIYSYARITIVTITLFLFGCLWFIVPSYICITHNSTYTFDPLFSPLLKQSIIAYIQENFLHKPFQSLPLQALKNSFPAVENARIAYNNEGTIHCCLEMQKPLARINDEYILMEQGKLFDKNFVEQTVTHRLPTVHMKNLEYELAIDHCRALGKIPVQVFEQFNVTWIDHKQIELRDKITDNFFIYTDVYTLMNSTLLAQYEKIKKQILSQRSCAKKQWRLDVRFKNQIIVAQKGVGDI